MMSLMMSLSPSRIAMTSLLAWLIAASAVYAQADQPTLDELLGTEPAGAGPGSGSEGQASPQAPDAQPQETQPAGVPLEESVQRRLSGQQAADLFEQVIQEMDEAALRLGRELDAGIQTQRIQESILAKLDEVIAAARQQQMMGAGGGGSPSGQPEARQQDAGGQRLAGQGSASQAGAASAQGAVSRSGTHSGEASPGQVEQVAPGQVPLEELRREWGHLPPRLRDELSEGLQERFSPVYRQLTEAYYRRLAQQEEQGRDPRPRK